MTSTTPHAKSFVVALSNALNLAAPDQASWVKGQETFWGSLQDGHLLPQALYNALDVAAPDEASWKAGKKAFFATTKGRKPLAATVSAGRTAAHRTTRAVRAAGAELAGKSHK